MRAEKPSMTLQTLRTLVVFKVGDPQNAGFPFGFPLKVFTKKQTQFCLAAQLRLFSPWHGLPLNISQQPLFHGHFFQEKQRVKPALKAAGRSSAVPFAEASLPELAGEPKWPWVNTNGIPFWGRCTTHFESILVGIGMFTGG